MVIQKRVIPGTFFSNHGFSVFPEDVRGYRIYNRGERGGEREVKIGEPRSLTKKADVYCMYEGKNVVWLKPKTALFRVKMSGNPRSLWGVLEAKKNDISHQNTRFCEKLMSQVLDIFY